MPLGLTNALATFQHLMNSVFADLLENFKTVCLDNLLVYNAFELDHLAHLWMVFEHFCTNQIFVKKCNCALTKAEVRFLGRIGLGQGNGPKQDPIHC